VDRKVRQAAELTLLSGTSRFKALDAVSARAAGTAGRPLVVALWMSWVIACAPAARGLAIFPLAAISTALGVPFTP